jgi:hypothetical protein
MLRPAMTSRTLRLGRDPSTKAAFELPPHHFVTHGVVVGMTGSGKTGLCVGLVEEALRSRVPVLMIDVKGDLANLALLFGDLAPASFAPWVDADAARRAGKTVDAVAAETAARWKDGLAGWGLDEGDVRALRESMELRVITPGTTAGEPLHVLSPLEQRSELWEIDEEAAREALSAALSLLLRMIDREADPARGREHVLLAHLCERRLRGGQAAGLEAILEDLANPPIARVGALAVDEFLAPKERAALAQDLNALIASPTFAAWRQGAPLDVAASVRGSDPTKVPAVILSVAHLGDDERMLVISLVLEQVLAWVRGLSGTTDLRALVLFDEVFGFLPPHPANPPTKRPMLALLKQARAFGVGLVVATQNPIDLDYKALSNAGVWFVGRLQTDADRERVVEGLAGSDVAGGAGQGTGELSAILKALPPRTFYVRDIHVTPATGVMETRWTLSYLRGPLTRQELKRLSPRLPGPAPDAPLAVAPEPASPPSPPSPAPTPSSPPALPAGWTAWFPHPPQAPVTEWLYAPHAVIVATVLLSDKKLGYAEQRRVALAFPIESGQLQASQVREIAPDAFRHPPVPGARYADLGGFFAGARAVASREKQLEELVAATCTVTVLENPIVEAVQAPGETAAAFHERVARAVAQRQGAVVGRLVAKHDAKIQRLAMQRDAAHAELLRAQASAPGGMTAMGAAIFGGRAGVRQVMAQQNRATTRIQKLQAKVASAEAALGEAVAKRNHEIATEQAELAAAGMATVARTIAPKKDGVHVERFGVLWLAR